MLISLDALGRMAWREGADCRMLHVLLGQGYMCQHVPVDIKQVFWKRFFRLKPLLSSKMRNGFSMTGPPLPER